MSKDLAFNYKAKNRAKELVNGLVYAPTQEIAFQKIKSLGYIPVDVPTLNIGMTIQAFIHSEFNKKDLMIFYRAMGKRMDMGRSPIEGIDSALSYLKDPKLIQALMLAKNFLNEGMAFATALKNAGFPLRDVEILRSTAEAGQQPATLKRLAEELDRNINLQRAIKATIKGPIGMFLAMYAATYGLIIGIAPGMIKFFKMLKIDFIAEKGNEKLPAFVTKYYQFANWFSENLKLASFLYFSALIGLIILMRSKYTKQVFDMIPLVKAISVKTDLANVWSSFALMYDAGSNLEEVCKMLSKAAAREEHRESFMNLARLVRSGVPIHKAVEKAGFPDFVVREIIAAHSSGELGSGIIDMSKGFALDVEEMSVNLKGLITIISQAILVVFVLGFFMVSYYPTLATTLGSL